MIFFFHTPEQGSVMVGSDHIPRRGEILRLTDHPELGIDLMTGIFRIEDVMYGAPNNPGHQRVDVYGQKVGELPSDLSYSSLMMAIQKILT